MEFSVIIVNDFQPLTIIIKYSILDVAAVLYLLLIVRIAKTNAILKPPVNKLFAVENPYHYTNQIDKG